MLMTKALFALFAASVSMATVIESRDRKADNQYQVIMASDKVSITTYDKDGNVLGESKWEALGDTSDATYKKYNKMKNFAPAFANGKKKDFTLHINGKDVDCWAEGKFDDDKMTGSYLYGAEYFVTPKDGDNFDMTCKNGPVELHCGDTHGLKMNCV